MILSLVPTERVASQPSLASPPQAEARRTTAPIRIDGRLEETDWQEAPRYSGLTQRFPCVGQPASERTSFQILYDAESLYVGVRCYTENPETVTARTLRFDSAQILDDDFLSLKIDPTFDRRTVYIFSVNPKGAASDSKALNNGEWFFPGWNTFFEVRTSRDAHGWQAEFRIPFAAIEFDPGSGIQPGFNLTRGIAARAEEADWAPIPPPFGGLQASYFGRIEGVVGESSPWRRLTVRPSLASGFTQAMPATGPGGLGGPHFRFHPGLDLKYLLTRSAMLQATVRTDFAEENIDDARVNLSRFQLYYPELRQFFLDGSHFFEFGLAGNTQPFFSRRIGLDATGREVPIIAGVRSYGLLQRTEYGIFNIQTEKTVSEPGRNFTVFRGRQTLFGQSTAGVVLAHQQDTNGGEGRNTAFGADFLLRRADDRLTLDGLFGGTLSDPDPAAAAKGTFGKTGFLRGTWSPGLWRMEQTHLYVDSDYNPETGFVLRNGIYQVTQSVVRSFRLAQRGLQQLSFSSFSQFTGADDVSALLDYFTELKVSLWTNAGYRFSLGGADEWHDVQQPFRAANRVTIPAGHYHQQNLSALVATPPVHLINGSLNYTYGGYYGGSLHRFSPTLSLRPLPVWLLTAGADVSQVRLSDLQADFTTAALNVASSYSLTRSIYFDLSATWNQASDQLVMQARYRWRFLPLSDFFVVYRDEREASGFSPRYRSLIFKIVLYQSF